MLPAASDEDVKAYGLTAGPLLYCFRRFFSPCESDTPCARAHGPPIRGFLSSSPVARGELQKKRHSPSVRVQRPTEKPEEKGKQPTAESEACSVQRGRRFIPNHFPWKSICPPKMKTRKLIENLSMREKKKEFVLKNEKRSFKLECLSLVG
ncbi:hypothetical protein EVAR_76801_1 [Eumeta japonica]|uniref:Uncharacterized protein n=1 Tax=Eumeta variegata TaxID=151549 RepID=A0A4C1STX4_EUMVA|nr:hypothetical protein EVAR_76801_1 [Eumeta japonica]